MASAIRQIGVSEVTFYRWRRESSVRYGANLAIHSPGRLPIYLRSPQAGTKISADVAHARKLWNLFGT
jgi:transposase-like protein